MMKSAPQYTLQEALSVSLSLGQRALTAVVALEQRVTELEQHIAKLEQKRGLAPLSARLGALESRPLLEDGDIWDEHSVYRKGSVTTYAGTSWVAREPNSNARPGTSDVWRLMVKSKGRQ